MVCCVVYYEIIMEAAAARRSTPHLELEEVIGDHALCQVLLVKPLHAAAAAVALQGGRLRLGVAAVGVGLLHVPCVPLVPRECLPGGR